MERYFQPEMECASREDMLALQNEKLKKQVRHVWENVPYYRKKMEEKGVTPDDIQTVDDLYKLPLISKYDLRDAYPYGLLGVPLKDCVRIRSTSGTTGKRVMGFYTQSDVDLWEDCWTDRTAAERAFKKIELSSVYFRKELWVKEPGGRRQLLMEERYSGI